jgi:AraC-like DNA-binding protein
MDPNKRYTQGFYGTQLGYPLIFHSGLVIEPIPHMHKWNTHNGYELVFVEEGYQVFQYETLGEYIAIPGGHFSIIPPKVAHQGKYGIFYPSSFYWVEVNPFTNASLADTPYTPKDMRAIFKSVKKCENIVTRSSPFLIQLLTEYQNALRKLSETDPNAGRHLDTPLDCSPELKAWIKTLILAIVIEAVHSFNQSFQKIPNKYVEQARQYIDNNFMDEINIHDVVKHLGISEAYLYNNFKEETGQTPNGYLLTLRLQKACDFLANTGKNVTDVAMETGFSSSQYFSNVFKNYAGESPSEFRKRIKADYPKA